MSRVRRRCRADSRPLARAAGFTFIDLLVVVGIVAILSAYAAMKMTTAGENTVWYQAQRLARDIRHAQILTSTWGRPLQVVVDPATETYSVSCVTAGAAPCDVSPIIDPVTGRPFTVTLEHGVTLAASPSTTVAFDILGRPVTGGTLNTASNTYTLSATGTNIAVAVAPWTGFVGVTP